MKDYKNYYFINESPELVYLALTRADTIALWTGYPAVMEAVPETEFSLWDGNIVGRNIEFEDNKKIVQEWYFGEQETPSIVTLKLHPQKKGTSVELRHINIPDEAFEDMVAGWNETYFAHLTDFYGDDE